MTRFLARSFAAAFLLLASTATFLRSQEKSPSFVIAGELVWDAGKPTGARPDRVLPHQELSHK